MTKIAEHGGDNPQDRDVVLLGLDPNHLQAVRIEHTAVLPVH